jgi:hypothetical protein
MATLKESLINEFEELIKNDSEIKKIIKSKELDENKLLGLFIEILNNKQKSMDNKEHPNLRDAVTGVNNFIKQEFNEN